MREGLDGAGARPDPRRLHSREPRHPAAATRARGNRSRPELIYDDRFEESGVADRSAVDTLAPPPGRGSWRPFQIAFLLAAIRSTADPGHPDRLLVDLIFFPTGGGKTEAYLGLSAFSMFLRRLRDPSDVGVEVLMRYTLRLLTAQQFQRAGALVCAMEVIRQSDPRLGRDPFTIGIWVGGETTPNTRDKRSRIAVPSPR